MNPASLQGLTQYLLTISWHLARTGVEGTKEDGHVMEHWKLL
jgi:hypothetical protein